MPGDTTIPKVLVVDDDYSAANLVKILLELEGFQVTVCNTLPRAVQLTSSSLDALIVDYYLPQDQNGLELLKSIRQGETSAPKNTPVVVISGDHRRRVEAEQAGANHFLLKPYSPRDLSKLLRNLISKGT